MFIKDLQDIPRTAMTVPGAIGAYKQAAVGPQEGWAGYVMRVMTLEPGGKTPYHAHPWIHVNYIISGEGTVTVDGQASRVAPGTVACIPAEVVHGFVNEGQAPLVFICIVPEEGDK